jgi:hypothetical protein
VRTELTRVRAAAVAWRNGLGALLAGLIGFSLIKGRSDVSTLADTAARVVGVLLLLAIVAGVLGAFRLLRAAHGQPSVTASATLSPEPVAQHAEAVAAARQLRVGIVATTVCAALLVVAVGVTWYGPPKADPVLRLETTDGTVCGTVVRIESGSVVVDTASGERSVALSAVTAMTPTESC